MPTAPRTLEFWYDYGSSASYLAYTQLARLQAASGCTLVMRPMLLGAVFQATGNQSPAMVAAKGRYMNDDFKRFAKRYGVPYAFNPHFMFNTLAWMRIACGLHQRDAAQAARFDAAMFSATWAEQLNLKDEAVLANVWQRAGFDPAALLALAQDPAVKDALKVQTQQAIDRGVFGAPSFFVGDTLFWGQDRLDFVLEALTQ